MSTFLLDPGLQTWYAESISDYVLPCPSTMFINNKLKSSNICKIKNDNNILSIKLCTFLFS